MEELMKKPVITDETAKELVRALISGNVGQREQNETLSEIKNEIAGVGRVLDEIYYVPVSYTEDTANGKISYSLSGVTFDELLKQYRDGKHLIARIDVGNDRYIASFSCYYEKKNSSGAPLQKFMFDAPIDLNQERKALSITKNLLDNKVICHMSTSGDCLAEQVSCNITIGTTECYTVAEALEAIKQALSPTA